MRIYIFGAHSRAVTTAEYLRTINPELTVIAFLFDNDEPNGTEINGIPILDIRKASPLDNTVPVYIGTKGVSHPHIIEVLSKRGFSDIRPVTVLLDSQLRKAYIKKVYKLRGRVYKEVYDLRPQIIENNPTACIYEVRSVYDKPYTCDSYSSKPYERAIQVGKELTNITLDDCSCFDNTGENISTLNKQMCEITGVYWMWKNAIEDYLGLVHYRRHFLLPDDWVSRMVSNDIDIILPTPMYLGPSIADNYRFRHVSQDWDVLMEVIKARSLFDYSKARECFSGTLFFPCNMFIMKRQLLNDYATWLFNYLFEVVERVGTREDVYQNRYPAFMAERMLTLYCFIHIDDLNIAYSDKNFLL